MRSCVCGMYRINSAWRSTTISISAKSPPEIWEFTVGGYQVLEKWLKDRKGRVLSNDDIQHWQRVVVDLGETRRLMAEIDALIPEWPMQ